FSRRDRKLGRRKVVRSLHRRFKLGHYRSGAVNRDFPTRIFHRVRRYKANIEGASCTSPKLGLLLKGSALQMGLENGVLSFATSLLSRDLRRRVDDDFRFALVQLNPCQTQP